MCITRTLRAHAHTPSVQHSKSKVGAKLERESNVCLLYALAQHTRSIIFECTTRRYIYMAALRCCFAASMVWIVFPMKSFSNFSFFIYLAVACVYPLNQHVQYMPAKKPVRDSTRVGIKMRIPVPYHRAVHMYSTHTNICVHCMKRHTLKDTHTHTHSTPCQASWRTRQRETVYAVPCTS